jgi:hypothetical protein
MKNIIRTCVLILITASVLAQSPNKMSYQSIIRNSSNALVTNSAVGIRISILQTTLSGTAVYVETQTPTTNADGLISIEIGGGTVVSGNFSTIDWANGPYFVKTETDPTGGTSYTITGTSQLLSVPYALHAKTAENVIGGNYNSLKYPQGTNGDYVAIQGNYNVPAGKTLYITTITSDEYLVGSVNYDAGYPVFPASTLISVKQPFYGGHFTGILVDSDPSLTLVMHSGSNYTVPAGKKLVVKSSGVIPGVPGEYFRFNGDAICCPSEIMGVYPSGSVLIPDNSNIGFTGYLINN